jgi:hypothetical protein
VALNFNTIRLDSTVNSIATAGVGVAFVAASIALGVSLGLVFPGGKTPASIDLLSIARKQRGEEVPEDVVDEVFGSRTASSRPQPGDWILIMGGKSTANGSRSRRSS